MITELVLGDITVEVVQKDIKNVHLSVNPPDGRVRVSAPASMQIDAIRAFALSKLGWIRTERHKFLSQDRETPREFSDRESHFVWGERYLLSIIEREQAPAVALSPSKLIITVRPGASVIEIQEVLQSWYRDQVRSELPQLIAKWESTLSVKVDRIFVQQMKTKWGSCNPGDKSIRLNTELAKKPREYLEYVLVHEMVHMLEPGHGPRFLALIDNYIPNWRHLRNELNRLPISGIDKENTNEL